MVMIFGYFLHQWVYYCKKKKIKGKENTSIYKCVPLKITNITNIGNIEYYQYF